ADAEQNVIAQEAEGRAQAARIRAIAEAEAEAIRLKAEALMQSGQAYLDLKRLEMAPAITREVAGALANGQFVNLGTSGEGGHSAAASGSDDVMRVVQTLMAAQIVTGGGIGSGNGTTVRRDTGDLPPQALSEGEKAVTRPAVPPMPNKNTSPIRK